MGEADRARVAVVGRDEFNAVCALVDAVLWHPDSGAGPDSPSAAASIALDALLTRPIPVLSPDGACRGAITASLPPSDAHLVGYALGWAAAKGLSARPGRDFLAELCSRRGQGRP